MANLKDMSNHDLIKEFTRAVLRVEDVSVFLNGIDVVRNSVKYLEEVEKEMLNRLEKGDK